MLDKKDKQYIADVVSASNVGMRKEMHDMRTEIHDEINTALAKVFRYLDQRFDTIEKRFDDQEHRLNTLYGGHDDHEGRIQNLELSI